MSITDELRKWGRATLADTSLLVRMEAIADRIDAEHEAQLNDAFETRNSDKNLENDGYVRLPKDADDVPWSVGDRDEDGNTVTQLRLSSDGWYAVTDGPSAFHPEQRRHYHAPTVEDVLRDFGIDWEYESDCEDRATLLKEYASKLRLAEGED